MDSFPGGQRFTLSTAETGTPLVSRGHLRVQQQNRDAESCHSTQAVNRPPNGGTSIGNFVPRRHDAVKATPALSHNAEHNQLAKPHSGFDSLS